MGRVFLQAEGGQGGEGQVLAGGGGGGGGQARSGGALLSHFPTLDAQVRGGESGESP